MTPMLTASLLTALLLPGPSHAEARALTAFPFIFDGQTADSERLERERERAAEQRAREQERRQEQIERQRERAAEQRRRAAEQRERERERQREQAALKHQGSSMQREKKTHTFRIGAGGELDLSNISGDILITKGGSNEAVVEIVKTARARSEAEARELLTQVQVEIAERGNRGEIKLRYPRGGEMPGRRGGNFAVSVGYTVTAPEGTRIRAASISGSIVTKDITGELALDTISGSIQVAGGGRIAGAKSISGPVEILDTTTDGSLNASSASGGLTLRRVRARSVELNSISGSVIMDEVECSRVEAQTISGDVRFSGPIVKNSRYELTSHSGSVLAAVSGGAGFEVEATSFSGSIRSDFPLNAGATSKGPTRSLRGRHGDGSAILDLTSFSGSIHIAKR